MLLEPKILTIYTSTPRVRTHSACRELMLILWFR